MPIVRYEHSSINSCNALMKHPEQHKPIRLIHTIMKRNYLFYRAALLLMPFLLIACNGKNDEQPVNELKIVFKHDVKDAPLVTGQLIYENAAGNPYEVKEIMYFISDLVLHHSDGRKISLKEEENIHYCDTKLPETLEWTALESLPEGTYDSLTFTFGLSEEHNKSFIFVNPPEVNMAWPEVLGGGYHYMMLNGWWVDNQAVKKPFNFHLGIGQIYKNNSGDVKDIIGFIHNHFTVKPSGGPFTVKASGTNELILTMHVDSWFDTPYIYNHNQWGGAIMQNQEAMHTGCMNGRDAFSIKQ